MWISRIYFVCGINVGLNIIVGFRRIKSQIGNLEGFRSRSMKNKTFY